MASTSRRPLRRHARLLPFALAASASVFSCATTRGELEPRYVAVHNALAAMGLAQVGPLQQGSLGEGRDLRLRLDLTAQCTTVVTLGGPGVYDLDVTLLDPQEKPVAHDTTKDPQAVVRACVETAGTYTLLVKMTKGQGDFLAATWTGGVVQSGGGALAVPMGGASTAAGAGTCESPLALAAGTFNGSTARGESDNEGACANSTSKELVYKLDLAVRQRVTVEVDPHFDAVLYVRKEDCADADAEVACNDDVGHQRKSRVDEVLEPGTYFVFVDGYSSESGAFRMNVQLADVPTLAETCQRARPLVSGLPVNGSTNGSFDHASASCGDGAKAADTVLRLDVAQRARVRINEHSDDFSPVIHLRRQCTDEHSEVACSHTGATDEDAAYTGLLDPGVYAVFADGTDRDADGRFTLLAEMAPEQGSGTQGDGCGDTIPLSNTDHEVEGDTFAAKDDVAGKCSGAGAADVVFRLDLPKRSRVSARMTRQEGHHVFVLSRTCGDRATEVACGGAVDEMLTPGTYFLAVDGATVDAFGKFAFDWRVRDVGVQESACRTAAALGAGQTVNGSTNGAGDKFTTSCGGREDAQGSPDKLYKIVLPTRTHIRLVLSTPTWDGVLALRKSCLEPPGTSGARAAEVACNNDSEDAHHARLDTTLDAGTYFVHIDGHASGNEGSYSLEYKVVR